MNKVITKKILLNSKGTDDIIDITDNIRESLRKIKLINGIVTVFVPGSTGALTTIEYEPGLLKDLPQFYEKLVPRKKSYNHDLTWGDANGFSHLRAALQGPSLTVPFTNGKLTLGTWQQVVFLEFDNRGRQGNLVLQFLGE